MSFSRTLAILGLAVTLLSGCASTQERASASCYWSGQVAHSCREFVEFNAWR